MSWSSATLNVIVYTDDLKVSPYRADGTSLGTATWVWCVAVDGELYVRAYSGASSRWFQAARAQRAGAISAAGMQFEVSFEPGSEAVLDRVDEAYRAKYARSRYLSAMLTQGVRQTTTKIGPRKGSTYDKD